MSQHPSKLPAFIKLTRGLSLDHIVKEAYMTRFFPELWYMTEAWLGPVKPRKNALVVGYSLGYMSVALAKSGWFVTTVDPSISGLQSLRQRFAKKGLIGEFELAPLEKLPFESGHFDAIIAVGALEIAAHPAELLKDMHRVLRPGGRAVIASINRLSPWSLRIFSRYLHPDVAPELIQCLSLREFEKVLRHTAFKIETIKSKAQYLPISKRLLPLRFPVPGVFIALLTR